MKIAVCVKQVPEGNSRIDPGTKRLDRSGEGALNAFDANAVEEALRLKDATGEGEIVLVSMGPAKAQDALRKAETARFAGARLVVEEATPEALAAGDIDLAFFSVGTAVSRLWSASRRARSASPRMSASWPRAA